ncbi:hypothetical protein SARC_16030 [Sphaeroforma arctica JP610]|uniref:Uncharacterized protein n=1 Tax=Sphaeroforma arctica JP610 TaxID=667725 RepID=A0A0L0F486_9EUKA|nr:hypothetical protein SARC_16030 [Sphaeroforma arctica JP610]KNC71429.1 hypothetical protein SARC_16030 [Sphaeroforma arctica JP610]|eukprot:XP_014145331.1 hypothetical protein SARC_16030 [Sphaeroforma arctica JP610]
MRRGRIGGPGRHGNAGAFAVGMAVGGRRSRDHSPDHKLVKTAVVASAIRPGPRRPHPVAKAAVVGSVVGNSRRPGLTLMLIRPRPMVMRPRYVYMYLARTKA